MITLPQLVTTDTDLTSGQPCAKAANAAQDFLALLAGALGADDAQGKDAPLTLADLQAAGGKLPQGLLAQEGDSSHAVKLADLLAAKEGQTDEMLKGLSEAQTLLGAMSPEQKNSALAALSQSVQKDDDSTALSNEDLASLSALFAMLPGQPDLTAPPDSAAKSLSVSATSSGGDARSLAQHVATSLTGDDLPKESIKTAPQGVTAESANSTPLNVPFAAASAQTGAETSPVAVAPGLVMTSSAQPAASPASAAPVLSAPLGSHEWQQTLSQHITLFTRQGQQSAELRLHPDDLGQVHISLKLDDNQAQLQMVSAHSHVRAALEAALPVLRTQLAESGIQLGQSHISSENFAGQQQSSSQHQQAPRTPGQPLSPGDEESELAVPATLQSAARGRGAVDIFA